MASHSMTTHTHTHTHTYITGCYKNLTAVRWRPWYPFELAAGCKAGTIALIDIRRKLGFTKYDGTAGSSPHTKRKGRLKHAPLRLLDMHRMAAEDLPSSVPPKVRKYCC